MRRTRATMLAPGKRLPVGIGAIFALLISACPGFCGTAPDPHASGPLEMLCGVGLIKPMEDLARAFKAEHGIEVRVSYGGSGELLGKLAMGRACDILLPGSAEYIEEAARRGWVVMATRLDLAYHVPVIAVPAENPAGIERLEDLAKPGVRVALGDPNACAIGKAAETVFERAGLAGIIEAHVRTAGASQLLLYLLMKQVDAAVLWEDQAEWPKAKGELLVIPIPKEINAVGRIAAARVSASKRAAQADTFLSFLATDQAKGIWRKWGFRPCGE